VVLDPGAAWQAEWGDLYRDSEADPEGAPAA
jgi:hypothetical protein